MTEQSQGQPENEPPFIKKIRVAILGLGLMGGSLALALRGQCAELLGVDPNLDTLALAERISLCNRLSPDPSEVLPSADLIVLAAPVKAILSLLALLPGLTPNPAIVLDLGSTKAQIVNALAQLPERFDPIGGHPMCGKERSSLVEAEAHLFQGAAFALTPLPRTSSRARSIVSQLVELIGAHPVWLNASTHDRWVAATSHTPYLIANALAAITPLEVSPMVGPGYRSTTRVSTTPANVMLDILSTNRENVLENLARFRCQLEHLETLLREDNFTDLNRALEAGAARQDQILITSA
jgi:prephenate dehydrogenase